MKKTILIVGICLLAFTTLLSAEERYNHFPAIESPDVPAALCNLKKYNDLLTALSNKTGLSAEDMVKVHELTYTLENALMRLNKTLETAAVELEEVHLASESLDQDTIKSSGKNYLQAIQPFLAPASCSG